MNRTKSYSEKELIAGIRSDHQEAIKFVYAAHFASMARFILNNNGTAQEAKDVYQEAFIVLYEKLKDEAFQLDCQIGTFLYSVGRRLWLKKLAEKNKYTGKIHEYESFIVPEVDEEDQEEKEQNMALMKEALHQLGEPCQTILNDFYIHRKSMQEIADKMGYTNMANAKNQKYKCLQRLKKIFFKHYYTKKP